MEDNVWSQKAVFDLINNDYILISLYVDDTEELPKELQGEVSIPMAEGKFRQQKIKTIGNKWTTFEQLSFRKISQPYYVLLSSDGYLLNHPKAYTPDAQEYADWLSCGIDALKKIESGEFNKASINQEGETKAPVEVEEIEVATWRYDVKSIGNNKYEVSIIADLAEGWHTYSQFQMADEGPLSTWIQFEGSDSFKILGDVKEPDMHNVYDPVWIMEIKQFEKTATFIYTIEYSGDLPFALIGTIDYMACDSSKCLNLNESFEIELK